MKKGPSHFIVYDPEVDEPRSVPCSMAEAERTAKRLLTTLDPSDIVIIYGPVKVVRRKPSPIEVVDVNPFSEIKQC